jgi:hypothetical protein
LTDWYELFEKKHLVDALLDRLRHRCITINIDGPSLRSPEAQGNGFARAEAPCAATEPSWRCGKRTGGSAIMTRTDLRVLFEIPDYWTPEQALAVYELIDGLREIILSRYEAQISDALREECAPSPVPEHSSDPSSERD